MWEIEMERPSHCSKCRGAKCVLYGQALPARVVLRPAKRSVAPSGAYPA
jgi:hypothetical protein